MRVLLISHVAPPHIGGVENLVRMEAESLRDAGHEVVWLTSDATGDGEDIETCSKLRLLQVPAWHLLERRFGVAYPLFAPRLFWHLWREVGRADLVHIHGLVFAASTPAALIARLRGRRVVCTDHGGLLRYRSKIATWALRALMETAGRVTARCSHRLLAYNRDLEDLLSRLSGDPSRVRFLQNPVDRELFRPPTEAQRRTARAHLGWNGKPRVLCVSRLLPHKGIDILLAAQDDAFEVVFCGPGDAAMRDHIRDSGAECLAPRPQADVRQLYHAADALALPSHNEGFPVVIQEALACGLPVVTTDHPSYAPYRGTPGLHLCEPTPAATRETLRSVVTAERQAEVAPVGADHATWLRAVLDDADTADAPGGFTRSILLVLVLAHIGFCVARWPAGTIAKRAKSIHHHEQLGAAGWHYRHFDEETRRIANWLDASVPPDHVVLFDGERQGALQLLAPLLYPRLLVESRARRGDRDSAGRAVFQSRPPWMPSTPEGTLVVSGRRGAGLRLEWR